MDANLFSRQVDLKDLGRVHRRHAGAYERRRARGRRNGRKSTRAEASSKLLPDTPINLPKLNAANVRLRYKGEHILGRRNPVG